MEKSEEKETLLACTVIVPSVEIGDLICGNGHKLALTKADAKTLESLGKIRIDGIK